mmetsp:Transcript_16816/g.23246  ORF Transcript_16816/g.23246 Transcript_16816/m.23246 type:complete len:131 (+) Transcript_16816:1118-1510(+)
MRKGGIRGVDGEEGGLLSNGVVSSAGEGDGGGPTSFVPSLLRRGRFALLEFGVELEDKFSDSLMFFRYTLLRVETGEGDGLGRKTPEFWRFAINLRLLLGVRFSMKREVEGEEGEEDRKKKKREQKGKKK